MERLNEIEKELSGIAPVLGKYGITASPYRVPAGYFEQFTENLWEKIHGRTDASVESAALTEQDTVSELAALSPLLASLERKTPYRVPDAYFAEFRADTKQPAAKPRLIRFLPGRRLMKYAVAAVVAGVIATTTFLATHNTQADPLNALSNVSDQDMANYLENHDVHWGPAASAPTASADFNDNDFSDLLSSVSDTELEQYLPDFPDQKQTTN